MTSAGSVSKTSVDTAPFSCPMLLAAQTFYTRKKKTRVSTDAGIFQIFSNMKQPWRPKNGHSRMHTPSGFIAHLCQKRCYLGCCLVEPWMFGRKSGKLLPGSELWQDRLESSFSWDVHLHPFSGVADSQSNFLWPSCCVRFH